jgi:hypothetical protein
MLRSLKILLILLTTIFIVSCGSIDYHGDKEDITDYLDSKIGVWNVDEAVKSLGSKDNPIRKMKDTTDFKYIGIWKITEYNAAEDIKFSPHYRNRVKSGRKMYGSKQTIKAQREYRIWFDDEFIMRKYTFEDIKK